MAESGAPGRAASRARYRELVEELAAIDTAYRRHLGDFFDATIGAGVHRRLEDLDDESDRLEAREQAVRAEIWSLALYLGTLGESTSVPGPRQQSSGAYFTLHRTWSRGERHDGHATRVTRADDDT